MFGIQGLLISAAVAAFLSGAGAWKITHTYDAAKLAKTELGYRTAELQARVEAAAEQAQEDKIVEAAAVAEASRQEAVTVHTLNLIHEVPQYVMVTKDQPCIPLGFVRLLDASVLGIDPASLPLPAGKSDDACSDVDPTALAKSIIANYGTAEANAEQLNALRQSISDLQRAAK